MNKIKRKTGITFLGNISGLRRIADCGNNIGNPYEEEREMRDPGQDSRQGGEGERGPIIISTITTQGQPLQAIPPTDTGGLTESSGQDSSLCSVITDNYVLDIPENIARARTGGLRSSGSYSPPGYCSLLSVIPFSHSRSLSFSRDLRTRDAIFSRERLFFQLFIITDRQYFSVPLGSPLLEVRGFNSQKTYHFAVFYALIIFYALGNIYYF